MFVATKKGLFFAGRVKDLRKLFKLLLKNNRGDVTIHELCSRAV